MRHFLLSAALLSLAICLLAPVLYFNGRVETAAYRSILAAASLGWFIFATAYATRKQRR